VSGALVLGEHITWNQPVGALLVVLGAATAQGLVRPRFARR
jgi:drug/metabolite transporter (DMT)-like permease